MRPLLLTPAALLRRLSPDPLTALGWCAVPVFALVLYNAMPQPAHPVFLPPGHFVHIARWILVGLALLMAWPVGWASRRPLPVLAVLLTEAAVARVCGDTTWPLFLTADVLVFYIAVTRSRRAAAAAVAGVLAVWALAATAFIPGAAAFEVLTGPWSVLVVTTAVAWILGSWIRLRQDHAEALRAQAATQAVQAERLRIAREMHDIVAHSIGAIAIQAGAAKRAVESQPDGVREALGIIEQTSRETLTGLRRMLGVLREAESEPEPSTPPPSLEDIDRLAATAADAGVQLEVQWHGQRRPLTTEIELAAYRVIQESVTNVVRHAGAAHCLVRVDYQEEELSIEVTDDGHASATTDPRSGYGTTGMRERVALLRGHFTSGPRAEGGFRVAARLPI
ncbi:signal transduction histidine kinase [Streptomyces sp. Ag109_O5-1]|uniref:sensor histidine kinase n=1 Tax=Streptomyces sp. Ag109_O5-1 TaxID=1938851 RepID=UPI000FAC1D2B|nr:histidine kinase [Streptomyces sp. Ag109_O5-1]RPE38681.1 signal transduction histidine kinase [Streptomyces sp. Ag109_O5-1]